MAPAQAAAKLEREKRVKIVLAFASSLASRLEKPQEPTLVTDLQAHIRQLPFQPSPAVIAHRDELEKLGTELWNTSTRLRRNEPAQNSKTQEYKALKSGTICLLRAYAFLLLDSAGSQMVKGRERKFCIRLMKVALKAAKVCILETDLDNATRVLERAATYEDILCSERENDENGEVNVAERLRLEYFAVRTVLAFRQDRLDMAEHMFARCKQLNCNSTPDTAENLADLFYEIGKQALTECKYELAVKWLERAFDMLGEQDLSMLSSEAGELKLCILQSLVQAHTKLGIPEAIDKAWHLVKLLETDYGDKMVVYLLKIELISTSEHIDEGEYYNVLARMIRTIVLNDTNFKTLVYHVHKLKNLNNVYACRALDDLVKFRLIREENVSWIEKALITRTWISTSDIHAESSLEQLQHIFDTVLQESNSQLSAPATHATQTLLWKKVEETSAQEQYDTAEAWCRLCLHPLLDKAGAQNRVKIERKVIQSAVLRQDYATARDVYRNMAESARDEPITRYLMYKVGLRSGDADFAADCLEIICRNSSRDATLLYACVMEAQSVGNKRQAINALERVLVKYDYTAPAGIHLPALLRVTLRLLQSELIKDGAVDCEILNQLCAIFEGAYNQAKESQRRPSTPEQQLFTTQELEWFSKNSYNLSLKHCAEIPPQNLVRLLEVCVQFIRLLQKQGQSEAAADLGLRLTFCEYLAACAYTTLARAENTQETYLQYYLGARKHCQEFRRAVLQGAKKLSGAAQDDILSKQLQIVKLELEAVLKLQRWEDLDDLFEQCWNCKSSDHYETLADLVLVIHSCLIQANVDAKYQGSEEQAAPLTGDDTDYPLEVLSMLQKIINLTSRQNGNDVVRLSRWLRCLFNLTLTYDESISLKCLDQVTQIAAKKHGRPNHSGTPLSFIITPPPSSPVKLKDDLDSADEELKQPDRYPATELEWMATSSFNRAVDFYLQDNDEKCKEWAEKAMMVAQWLGDDGQLRDLLMEKFSALQFDK